MKNGRLGLLVVGIHVIDLAYPLRKEASLLQRAVGLAVAEASAHIEMKIP
ncbi:MAG: hypothetical protein SPL44_04080 [Bacteroidales bacterium]|jgi:hypothetical protein|nr:hypothetical protein [Bacteroidales bacterium]